MALGGLQVVEEGVVAAILEVVGVGEEMEMEIMEVVVAEVKKVKVGEEEVNQVAMEEIPPE